MASVKVVIKNKIYSDGTTPVLIRITQNRKSSFKKIAAVEPKYFDPKKQRIRQTHPRHIELNQLISERVAAIETMLLDNQRNGVSTNVQNILNPKANPESTLITFAQKIADNSYEQGKIEMWEAGCTNIRALEKYIAHIGAKTFSFDDFTEEKILDFINYCRDVGKMSENSISARMAFFKKVFKLASHPSRKLTTSDPFRFLVFKMTDPIIQKLSPEEFARFEALPLQGYAAVARDTFLLQYYLYGARISDILLLRKENIVDGFIEYRQRKTKVSKNIKLHTKALAIVQKYISADGYILPWMRDYRENPLLTTNERIAELKALLKSRTCTINRSLKAIELKYGFRTKIRTHTSRHSFATHGAKKTKDIQAISQALGHKSIAMTQKYLARLDQSEIDDRLQSVYD